MTVPPRQHAEPTPSGQLGMGGTSRLETEVWRRPVVDDGRRSLDLAPTSPRIVMLGQQGMTAVPAHPLSSPSSWRFDLRTCAPNSARRSQPRTAHTRRLRGYAALSDWIHEPSRDFEEPDPLLCATRAASNTRFAYMSSGSVSTRCSVFAVAHQAQDSNPVAARARLDSRHCCCPTISGALIRPPQRPQRCTAPHRRLHGRSRPSPCPRLCAFPVVLL